MVAVVSQQEACLVWPRTMASTRRRLYRDGAAEEGHVGGLESRRHRSQLQIPKPR